MNELVKWMKEDYIINFLAGEQCDLKFLQGKKECVVIHYLSASVNSGIYLSLGEGVTVMGKWGACVVLVLVVVVVVRHFASVYLVRLHKGMVIMVKWRGCVLLVFVMVVVRHLSSVYLLVSIQYSQCTCSFVSVHFNRYTLSLANVQVIQCIF